MSRCITIGDTVRLRNQVECCDFKITNIVDSIIYLDDRVIYYNGTDWQLWGYEYPHSVEFREGHFGFTSIYELDELIFLNLPHRDVLNILQVNKECYDLCIKDSFWREKVEKDYKVVHLKPEKETYRQQYESILKIKKVNMAVERIDALTHFENIGQLPNIDGANLAAEYGDLTIIHWLMERGILPDSYGISLAVGMGHTEVADITQIPLTVEAVNNAVLAHDIPAIQYCISRGVLPDRFTANMVARYGNIDILNIPTPASILRMSILP